MTHEDRVGSALLASRFLLVPMYVGLTGMMLIYDWVFMKEIWAALQQEWCSETLLLVLLGLVDISMVANMVTMTTIGGYHIFVQKIPERPGMPRFLNNMTSGMLKVKLAFSLVGVSSVHLLKIFLTAKSLTLTELAPQLVIHSMFLIGTLICAVVERINHPAGAPATPNHEPEIH